MCKLPPQLSFLPQRTSISKSPLEKMAELAVGLFGAAATVGAAQLATGSGFTGRHESSYREERMDTKRSISDFEANRRSGDVTLDMESEFSETKNEATERARHYHESIESYKEASWFNLPTKAKKRKDVRKWKRLTRQSNYSLRTLNELISSGSDTSSITATSGSPPGSNLADDDIHDWAYDVHGARADDAADAADNMRMDSFSAFVRSDGSSLNRSEGHDIDDRDSVTGVAGIEDDEVSIEDDESNFGKLGYHPNFHDARKARISRIIEKLKDSDFRTRNSAASALEKLAYNRE
ncbi:hypothetical protein C8F04DRAFT_1098235 [Mycena alexandri]|uniref:Uncharacterized protein n=1 Tax=Mycena alexandri TaxID=1745969 RepID=A0AAD6X4M0_9AGAR|nr:hypothetical protein C8F04DRAFT_1098235 [Mycena alexandri]